MSQQWFFIRGGQQQGPVSGEQLRQFAATGHIQPTDLVWKKGMSQWTTASSVTGLFAEPAAIHRPSTPPPLPTDSADSQADSSDPTNIPQHPVPPFGDWYRATWLGRTPLAIQAIVWLLYGFLWIPGWYFWTVTPAKQNALTLWQKVIGPTTDSFRAESPVLPDSPAGGPHESSRGGTRLENRMDPNMGRDTHRCKSCGGQLTPTNVRNILATVAGVILGFVGVVFGLTLIGLLIAFPLYYCAVGLFSMKKFVFKCQRCGRVFNP